MAMPHNSVQTVGLDIREWVSNALIGLMFCVVGFALLSSSAFAQQSASDRSQTSGSLFGGPSSPEVFLDDIRERSRDSGPNYIFPGIDRAMEPWFAFKDRIENQANFRFGGHYQVNYQKADRVLNQPDYGFGGLFRFTGIWKPGGLDNPEAGRLEFTFDYRHAIGDGTPPSDLGRQFGYVGTTNAILGDTKFDLYSLYYVRPFGRGDSGLVVGRIDPNNYFNTHGFSSPWTGFMNNEVVNSVSLAQPQSSWGILSGLYFNENVYALAGVFDANGSTSDNLEFFSGGAEFWSGFEVGYVPSRKERLEKKISLSLWHVDARDGAGTEESYGSTFTASWTFGDWNPFTRVGWSNGNAPPYNKHLLMGFRKKMRNGADVMGFAHSRGESSAGLGWQSATELFYNYYFAKNLAMTFDIQRIGNPLLNPVDDEVWLLGIRTRLTF
ncbi:hypothetical protein [Primorskyibacter sp. S87]|uniref:hypothetical protein n=1 Tax=Primorskyibacter sp. S87 TaxID=3415126 RepID=UPI003C7D7240